MSVDAFTISSNNYLGMARVFAESYRAHHPGATVYTCLVDHRSERIDYEELPFEIITAEELDIPNFNSFSFRYNILELNTAVKPFMFKYLRDRLGLDRCFYFDPDILVHDSLEGLEAALAEHLAVLTPHLTRPIDNVCRPPERVIGMCGVYNLGFLGLRLDDRTAEFLDWWCDRLDKFCFVDLANGMFVDQSWMDFAPAYLESAAIMRDPIYNVAYWNLPNRHPEQIGDHWEIDGSRVGFFHFSGVDLDDLSRVSRHQDRVDLGSRPELRPLFEEYRERVRQSRQPIYRSIPYHYDRFRNTDILIPGFARIALQETDPSGLRWPDPFCVDVPDSFFAWLTEPVASQDGVLNRAAMYLWRQDPSVQDTYPHVPGEDLPEYLNWYVNFGAPTRGLDPVFSEPLERFVDQRCFWDQESVHRLSNLDLSRPGASTEWLNEPFDKGKVPLITRLAMAIHCAQPDIAEAFPDPLHENRAEFAYWMTTSGAVEFSLDADLVQPVRDTMSPRASVSSRFREILLRALNAARKNKARTVDWAKMLPTPEKLIGAESSGQIRHLGVNVVGTFEDSSGQAGIATGLVETLNAAGIPHARVPVDHDLPEEMICDRLRFLHGAPYPVTVLVLPTDQWANLIANLPIGSRLDGKIVGYCFEPADIVDPPDMVSVDEAWVPSHYEAGRLVKISPVPVRPVLPPLSERASSNDPLGLCLDPDVFWFFVNDHGQAGEDSAALSAAIECVRRITAEGEQGIGLCALVDFTHQALAEQVRHLPIRIVCGPIDVTGRREILAACDAYLDLRAHPSFDELTVEAVFRGIPVIANGWFELEAVVHGESNSCEDCSERRGPRSNIERGIQEMKRLSANRGGERSERDETEAENRRMRWQDEARDQWRREIWRIAGGRGDR